MTRDWYKAIVLLVWLTLPINALNYRRAWDRLPSRMAVHFDVNRQPNGYASKERAAMLGLGILASALVLCTVAMLISRVLHPRASWPVLIVSCVVLGFICYGNSSIIEFNLRARETHSELIGLHEAIELCSTGQPRAAVSTRNLILHS
jgi:uncharacterized membrane protein